MIEFEGFERKYQCELSGGMRQRCGDLPRFAKCPEIFLMDEPFDALDTFDAMTREHMNERFQQIHLETRKTAPLITYSLPEAVFLADWVSRQNGPDRSRRSTTRPLLNRGGSAAIQFFWSCADYPPPLLRGDERSLIFIAD